MVAKFAAIPLCASCFLVACAGGPPGRTTAHLRAEPSAIAGVPVPAGSILDEQGVYDGGEGIVMAFYTNPKLTPEQALRFYDRQMPPLGWKPLAGEATLPRERTFERDGVPVLIGVEAEAGGCRISILRGARGDWRFMPQMKGPQ
jgi:hypothetical protein